VSFNYKLRAALSGKGYIMAEYFPMFYPYTSRLDGMKYWTMASSRKISIGMMISAADLQ